MKTAPFSVILCASPTCRASITIPADLRPSGIHALAVSRRWAIEQQIGDTEPRPYCERCKDGTDG